MNRNGALVLLIVGAVLVVLGLRESETAVSELSEIFNGRPSRDTRLFLASGIACLGVGGWMLRGSGKS